MLGALSSCAPAQPAQPPAPAKPAEPKKGGSIVVADSGSTVPSPDPHLAATISGHSGASMIADPLLMWKDEKYVGLLAEKWDVSPDGLTYTFTLREGIKFHNGTVIDANAVKANYERIRDPKDPKPSAGSLALVDAIEVVNPRTLRLKLKSMDPDFLRNLIALWIIDPATWGGVKEGKYPAGSGAFKVAQYVEDQKLVLERFDGYWDGPAVLDRITIKAVPDPGTQVVELETGSADIITFAPPREGARLSTAGFKVMPFGRVNWARVVINMKTVDDLAIRKAICYAINREAIIQVAYSGYGEPMLSLTVPGSWGHIPAPAYTYNVAEAKKVLDAAGYKDTNGDGIREKNGKNIVLHLPTRGDDEAWLRATQMIQQMLFDIGIGTSITTAARLSYYTEVRVGNYDISWWLSNAPPEPPIAFGNLEGASYWNVSQLPKDSKLQLKLDELIAASRKTLDQKQRAEYFKQINQLVYDEAIEALGMWLRQIYVASPKLQNIYVAPSGIMYQFHKWSLK